MIYPDPSIDQHSLIAVMSVIQTPFLHVPMYVVEAIAIGWKPSYFSCFSSIPSVGFSLIRSRTVIICQITGQRFPTMKRPCRSRPTCIFPLCFSGQSILPSSTSGEVIAELHCFVPVHSLYWALRTFEITGVFPHERFILSLRYRILPHLKEIYSHLMLWAFYIETSISTLFLASKRSHHKVSC